MILLICQSFLVEKRQWVSVTEQGTKSCVCFQIPSDLWLSLLPPSSCPCYPYIIATHNLLSPVSIYRLQNLSVWEIVNSTNPALNNYRKILHFAGSALLLPPLLWQLNQSRRWSMCFVINGSWNFLCEAFLYLEKSDHMSVSLCTRISAKRASGLTEINKWVSPLKLCLMVWW